MAVWVVAAAALAIVLAGFVRLRRLQRRLDRMTQSYWELRYEFTSLRARVAQLEGAREASPAALPPVPPSGGFVPLSSLKR